MNDKADHPVARVILVMRMPEHTRKRFYELVQKWRAIQRNEDPASDEYETWSVRDAIGRCADDLVQLIVSEDT